MEIIIEFDKKESFPEFSLVKRPHYIAIGVKKEKYYLIYNEIEHQITEIEVNELLKIINEVNLQILPDYGIGCDGETYSIKIVNGWNSVEFNWWSDTCGIQWKSLGLFSQELMKLKNKYTDK